MREAIAVAALVGSAAFDLHVLPLVLVCCRPRRSLVWRAALVRDGLLPPLSLLCVRRRQRRLWRPLFRLLLLPHSCYRRKNFLLRLLLPHHSRRGGCCSCRCCCCMAGTLPSETSVESCRCRRWRRRWWWDCCCCDEEGQWWWRRGRAWGKCRCSFPSPTNSPLVVGAGQQHCSCCYPQQRKDWRSCGCQLCQRCRCRPYCRRRRRLCRRSFALLRGAAEGRCRRGGWRRRCPRRNWFPRPLKCSGCCCWRWGSMWSEQM